MGLNSIRSRIYDTWDQRTQWTPDERLAWEVGVILYSHPVDIMEWVREGRLRRLEYHGSGIGKGHYLEATRSGPRVLRFEQRPPVTEWERSVADALGMDHTTDLVPVVPPLRWSQVDALLARAVRADPTIPTRCEELLAARDAAYPTEADVEDREAYYAIEDACWAYGEQVWASVEPVPAAEQLDMFAGVTP